jgi:hypothetical protein
MPKGRKKEKKAKKGMPPSSYVTMPHYFPAKQLNIAKNVKARKRRKKM